MSNYDADIHAISSWKRAEGGYTRTTGRRREEPGVCHECGEDITHPSFFDPTCGEPECRERWILRRGPVDRWLAMGGETR